MGVSKPNAGSFTSDKQPKRRRGKAAKTYLLEAMKAKNLTPTDIWAHTLDLAIKEGDSSALGLIVNRLLPALKPTTETLPTGLVPNGWLELSRTSKINYLAMLVLSGSISVDVCVSLAKMLESAAVAESADQLDLIMDGQVVLGDGDKKSIDRLKFAQDLNDRIVNTVQADRDRLRSILTDEETGDADTEPTTDNDTNNTNEELTDE